MRRIKSRGRCVIRITTVLYPWRSARIRVPIYFLVNRFDLSFRVNKAVFIFVIHGEMFSQGNLFDDLFYVESVTESMDYIRHDYAGSIARLSMSYKKVLYPFFIPL
jgi:hypothetical protein